jgi:hypothetical protein
MSLRSNKLAQQFLRKQFGISAAQAKELSFDITPIKLNSFRIYTFSISNVSEDAICRLKILAPNMATYNSSIIIDKIEISIDGNSYISNNQVGLLLNDILNNIDSNLTKHITTPFLNNMGSDNLSINQMVDEINTIFYSSSVNLVKTYRIEFKSIPIYTTDSKNSKNNLKGGNCNPTNQIFTTIASNCFTVDASFYTNTTSNGGAAGERRYIWHTGYSNGTCPQIWQRCNNSWNSGNNGPAKLHGNAQNHNYANQYSIPPNPNSNNRQNCNSPNLYNPYNNPRYN